MMGGRSDVAIRVEHLGKRYRIGHGGGRPDTLRDTVAALFRRGHGAGEAAGDLWALREVSFEIARGEVVGIIGRNGAGKSTLLKVVSRVIRPNRGRVWVRGHLAPLLELGAGFHPELTGRENVFLNGTLLGYTHAQMAARFDEITEFAEIGEFIDAPLRTYSSGMVVRLGFAVATSAQPDILIMDEVLSVGDEYFQEKCKARMAGFRRNGATILFVAHSMDLVRSMCKQAAWLDHGQIRALGPVEEVIAAYHELSQ